MTLKDLTKNFLIGFIVSLFFICLVIGIFLFFIAFITWQLPDLSDLDMSGVMLIARIVIAIALIAATLFTGLEFIITEIQEEE